MPLSSLLEQLSAGKLGETTNLYQIRSAEENRIAALQLVSQAQRSLCIYTLHLDAPIYNNVLFTEAVAQLAIRSRHAQVRILIQDSKPVVREGHRLVELSYRLSSRIKIRKISESVKEYYQAFLVVDGHGVLHRRHADRSEATVSFCSSGAAAPLLKHFDDVWNISEPDPSLRRLSL